VAFHNDFEQNKTPEKGNKYYKILNGLSLSLKANKTVSKSLGKKFQRHLIKKVFIDWKKGKF
jgi:hypothetical protein